jgi:hypothetical protein
VLVILTNGFIYNNYNLIVKLLYPISIILSNSNLNLDKNSIFRKDNLEYQFEHTLGDNGNGEISVDETYPYYKDLLIDINTEIPQNKKTNFKVITEIKELRLEDGRVIK